MNPSDSEKVQRDLRDVLERFRCAWLRVFFGDVAQKVNYT